MVRLYLKCKTCGMEFASGIDIDKESFKSITLVSNYHVCPRKHSNSYDKQDYYFKLENAKSGRESQHGSSRTNNN